jgi:hypothetical protein
MAAIGSMNTPDLHHIVRRGSTTALATSAHTQAAQPRTTTELSARNCRNRGFGLRKARTYAGKIDKHPRFAAPYHFVKLHDSFWQPPQIRTTTNHEESATLDIAYNRVLTCTCGGDMVDDHLRSTPCRFARLRDSFGDVRIPRHGGSDTRSSTTGFKNVRITQIGAGDAGPSAWGRFD